MVKQMTPYFAAQKQESLLFIAVGVPAVGTALWLWVSGHRLKSMAFSLVAAALSQIVGGA